MPVRIYDISRRLGLENKEVLDKAKELGIKGVRTASSTLDKITAEYFEAELRQYFADKIAARQLQEAEAAARAAAAVATETVEEKAEPAPAESAAEPQPSAPADLVGSPGLDSVPSAPPVAEPVAPVPGAGTAVAAPEPERPAAGVEAPVAEIAAPAPPRVETAVSPEPAIAFSAPAPATAVAPAEIRPVVPAAMELPVGSAAPAAEASSPVSPAASAGAPPPVAESSGPAEPPMAPAAAPVARPVSEALDSTVSTATGAVSGTPAPKPLLTQPLPAASPPKPKIGEKIGFIPLPPRPQAKSAPKATPAPAKPAAPAKAAPPKPEPLKPKVPEKATATPVIKVTAPAVRDDKAKTAPKPAAPPGPKLPKIDLPPNAPVVSLKPPISVRALAEKLNQKPFKIIAELMELGVFANVNQTMDVDFARAICAKYGYRFEVEKRERHGPVPVAPARKAPDLDAEDRPEELRPRPPVVTVMGHVDHGKTTLLDAIRKSNVAAKEAGGITQHIGAYTISFPHPERKGQLAQITFLDTPGHAAFSAMRARGANVTDIVVLVVAANDGVMPQTVEALNHARAAHVPIIVAVNKIDHPSANPLRVRQQLQELGLVPDEWGGDTIFVDVSALTKKGVDKLLEMILLQADLLELKANPNRAAKGNIIESGISPGGPTATALVRKGTLRVGDALLCGPYYGRVRALINEEGQRLKEAGPSMAVKVLGLNGVPEPGAEFMVVEDEKKARELAEQRQLELRARAAEGKAKITLENLFQALDAQQAKVLKLVVKADTQGSVEAIVDALKKIESDKVSLEIIHSAVGTISESDIMLASASKAVVIGFHTRVDSGVQEVAKREGVQIKLYTIIYELIDQVREAMAGLLEPVTREVVLGAAEVKQIFPLSKGPAVAGCVVTQGRITKGRVRVRRRKDVIFEGHVQSLRRFQDEVAEVRAGLECGIRLEGFGDYQVGDVIECYTVEKVAQTL